MKNSNKINKVTNFEGYWFICAKCGRKIKHAYKVNNSKDVYGSECVYLVAGIPFDGAEKQIKKQKSLVKMLKARFDNQETYGLKETLKEYKMTFEEYSTFCLNRGFI